MLFLVLVFELLKQNSFFNMFRNVLAVLHFRKNASEVAIIEGNTISLVSLSTITIDLSFADGNYGDVRVWT